MMPFILKLKLLVFIRHFSTIMIYLKPF